MSWPDKKPPEGSAAEKKTIGKGVFRKCDQCGETIAVEAFARSYEVCSHCGQHHRLSAAGWRRLLTDEGVEEWDAHLQPSDPLEFVDQKGYPERVAAAQQSARAKEAVEIGRASIGGVPVAWGAFLFAFMGGSMGSVAGEKIARLFERATVERLPVVLLQASGGARMQEGILSLMQMAKTVAALEKLKDATLPFISVLLNPTTGGVAASFALLGDVNIAEPRALIGFAGARVIETTIRQKLPEGFQRSEFLLAHGMIDRIVSRLDMKREISEILGHLLPRAVDATASHGVDATASHGVDATASHGVDATASHGVDATASHGVDATASHGVDATASHGVDATASHGVDATAFDGVAAHSNGSGTKGLGPLGD